MNGLGKLFRKKSNPKNRENSNNHSPNCRKIAAVDSHNFIGIERKENINKN